MLGRRGEGGLDFCGTGNDDGGHAVNPPVPGGASQLSKDAVHPLDEMRLVHRLADLCAYPSRVRLIVRRANDLVTTWLHSPPHSRPRGWRQNLKTRHCRS